MSNSKKWTPKKAAKSNKSETTEEQSEIVFPAGIKFFEKHEKAPDFVLGSIIISPDTLFEWLGENAQFLHNTEKYGSQLKLQVKKSKGGAVYVSVDTYGLPE